MRSRLDKCQRLWCAEYCAEYCAKYCEQILRSYSYILRQISLQSSSSPHFSILNLAEMKKSIKFARNKDLSL